MAVAQQADKKLPGYGIKIVFISLKPQALKAPIAYLNNFGYSVTVSQDVAGSLNNLGGEAPNFVFVDWNIQPYDVRKVYRFLSLKYKFNTYVFTTEKSHRATMTLMRSGIPHTVFPPVSGQGLHVRIQGLIKVKSDNKQAHVIKSKKTISTTEEKDDFNEQIPTPQAEALGQIQFTTLEKDSSTGTVSLIDEIESLKHDVGEITEELDETFFDEQKSDSDIIQKGAEQQRGLGLIHIKSRKIRQEKLAPEIKDKLLEMDQELKIECQNQVANQDKDIKKEESTLIYVNAKNVSGYFYLEQLYGSKTESFDDYSLKLVKDFFKKRDLSLDTPSGKVLIDNDVIVEAAAEHGFEFDTSSENKESIAFGFTQSTPKDRMLMGKIEDMLPIQFQDELEIDEPLGFDLYLHMPANNKFLRYLKAGTPFTEEISVKISHFGVKELYIKQEDLNQYLVYDFLTRLKTKK